MMTPTRWWWVRHAPVPDPEGRITGQLDLPCDTSDEELLAALAKQLPRNALLVESGMMRTSQTIAALEATGVPLVPSLVEPDLIEQDFGRWQGHGWAELTTAKDPDLPAFWAEPAYARPPAGESFADVVDRVRPVVNRLSAQYEGRDIIAVAHAGTIRAALAIALDIKASAALNFVVEPLSLTRIDAIAGVWRVQGVNWLAL